MRKRFKKGLSILAAGMLFAGMCVPSFGTKAAETAAEIAAWNNSFLENGRFKTDAPGFPNNYVFKITTSETLQNATNNATVKKELFHAIKESGRAVTLIDNCASYVINPEDVKDIPEADYSKTVQLGSYYRTGTTYPPVARTIAKDVIASDDHYLMGRDFSFWQITAFPDVLNSCTVHLEVTNAGLYETGANAASATAIAARFQDAARQGSLHVYVYASQKANLSTLQNPTVAPGKAVAFRVDGTRAYLISTVSLASSEDTANQAQQVISKINAIPALSSGSREAAVLDARNAYDELSFSAKALVSNDSTLFAREVEDIIAKIPATVSAADESLVLAARYAYNALAQSARSKVSNLNKLQQAETAMAALLSPIKVACVGDSITKGQSYSSNPDTNSYPAQLQKMLGLKYEVKNFGVGGSTLLKKGDKPYWNQPEFTASSEFAPKIVIIMLGTNDAKSQNWAHRAEFESNLADMVNHYRSLPSSPAVYIATSPTAYVNGMNVTDAVISGEIVPLQKKVAADLKVPVIDVNNATKNNSKLFTDGIHPNDDGYAVIANAMRAIGEGYANAKLATLTLNGTPIADFDPIKTSYTIELPAGSTVPTITASAQMPDAVVTVTQAPASGGAAKITVKAQNGTTVTYTVNFIISGGSQPSESEEPSEPSQAPSEPSNTGAQPSETKTTTTPSTPSAKTGETGRMVLPVVSLLAALITAISFVVLRRRPVQKAR